MTYQSDLGLDSPAEKSVAFTLNDVSKFYPGVQALKSVSLTGYAGEVLAICGANGAGKSTLAKILAGQELPTSGSVEVAGYPSAIRSPSDAEDAGILLMHQEPLIVEDFTIEENVWLSRLNSAGSSKPWSLVPRTTNQRTLEALSAVGLEGVQVNRIASELGPGLRQMLALSRTQVIDHKVLLLDETTASTTEDHFKDVLELVKRERDAGVSIIFVSHRMDEVFAMADRIAVLRNGELIDLVTTARTTPDDVMTLMIGEAVQALDAPEQVSPHSDEVLKVEGLTSGSATDINFSIRQGEVLGIYGLVGSGRSSIARSISGNQSRDHGVVLVHGKPVNAKSPGDAVRHKIAYLTEDRRREGFVPDYSNGMNMTLAVPKEFSHYGIINVRKEKSRVKELIKQFQVKGGAETLTRTLSGGNQQKVVIAKWLETDPDVIILDEPTKGIDVGARLNIYQIIRNLAESGKAVLVISSEAEEVLMLCNRVLTLKEGRVVGEFIPATSTTDDLIRASLGGETA